MTFEKTGSDAQATELRDSLRLNPFKLTYYGLSKTIFFPSNFNMCQPNKNPWGLLMSTNFNHPTSVRVKER